MQPYRSFLSLSDAVLGLEIDTPENRASAKLADVFYDGVEIPFPAGAFDGVLCNQVLEHAIDPGALLREIGRVLATRGTLILSVPFLWPEHEQPNDNQRFTTFGLGHALAEAGLEVQVHLRLVPSGAAICALFADQVNGAVRSWWLPARLAVRATAIATANIVGCLLSLFTPREAALFLDNFVVARKLEAAGAR